MPSSTEAAPVGPAGPTASALGASTSVAPASAGAGPHDDRSSAPASLVEVSWSERCGALPPNARMPGPIPASNVDRAPFAPGVVILYVRPETTEAQARAAAKSVGGTVRTLGNGWKMPAGVPSRVPKYTEIAVPPATEVASADALRRNAAVVAAWPDYARAEPSRLRSGRVIRRDDDRWEAGVIVVGFRAGPTSSKPAVDEAMASLGYPIVLYDANARGIAWVLARVEDCTEQAATTRAAAHPAVRYAELNRISRLDLRR